MRDCCGEAVLHFEVFFEGNKILFKTYLLLSFSFNVKLQIILSQKTESRSTISRQYKRIIGTGYGPRKLIFSRAVLRNSMPINVFSCAALIQASSYS
jgi:hypothetical protein